MVTADLVHALEKQARVHTGGKARAGAPSSVILHASNQVALSESVERHRELGEDAPPILVLGWHLDMPLAREAVRSGASGVIHAGMTPNE